jgi:hypothetical protein
MIGGERVIVETSPDIVIAPLLRNSAGSEKGIRMLA